ncbi:MAG: organic hydroperoxide resistance protein [Thermoleophilaceae bacterium]
MADPLYTAHAHVTGGRTGGAARTDDGKLDVRIEPPTELGGSGEGTNPEQLFAAGFASCFLSALKLVAGKREVPADDATVDSDVHLFSEGRGFKLGVTLRVAMPGVDQDTAQKMVETAHEVCPYSNATRGNIEVELSVEESAAA